jgi:hypothetical protein
VRVDFQAVEPLTTWRENQIDDEATTLATGAVASSLQNWLGQKTAAEMLGLGDPKQLGRYQRQDGPKPRAAIELRMREAYKLISMISTSFNLEIAKSWLLGTNARLGDRAPATLIREEGASGDFARLRRAAREFVLSQATVRDPMADIGAVEAALAKPMAERLELALSWNLMASELRAGMAAQEGDSDASPI